MTRPQTALRELITLLFPGLASLLPYVHLLLTAPRNNGFPAVRRDYDLQAAWGELAMAAILTLVAVVHALALLPVLGQRTVQSKQRSAGGVEGVIGPAIAAGLAAAVLYGVTAAVFYAQPSTNSLRWSVPVILPSAMWASAIAILAWHHRVRAATNGLALGPVEDLGGRTALIALLGWLMLEISRSGPSVLATVYALAIALLWIHHARTLARARHTSGRRLGAASKSGKGGRRWSRHVGPG